MAQKYKPIPTSPFVKGLAAETDYATQPKGTFPRGSNFLLNKRGALDVCDGSQVVHAFQGQIQTGRGKILVTYYFSPTGVSSYYLALIQGLDLPLGPPQNLTVATAAGGTLAAGTYFYKVTAIDGVGGETSASNEVSQVTAASGKNTLTWNIVPNAFGYNVYRGTAGGTETQLVGANVPVAQPALGNLTVSFVDDGTDANSTPIPVTGGNILSVSGAGIKTVYTASFGVSSTAGFSIGMVLPYVPGSNAHFAANWKVFSIVSATQIIATLGPAPPISGLFVGAFTVGGSFTTVINPPNADTTQQIALFKMPLIVGSPAILPVAYDNTNIVALFPAGLRSLASAGGGGGGSGGGGGTGGGGSGGGGRGGGGGGRLELN